MATAANYPITGFVSFFNAPLVLARHDTMNLVIFVVVNIVFGQIGIIGSVWIASSKSVDLLRVVEQNLNTGAFVTFSISLIVSAMAIVVVEVIDAARRKEDHVAQLEQKLFWGILGLFVLLFSTLHVGSIISAEQAIPNTSISSQSVTFPAGSPLPGVSTAPLSAGLSNGGPTNDSVRKIDWHQVFLWLASIIIAIELFSLYRIHLSMLTHAEERQEEVQSMSKQAQNQAKTTFDEIL